MALKVKAVEKKIKFNKQDEGVYRYVMQPELANTAIQITCYDRNGNEVKRVTSSAPGTVEDNENEDNGTTDNGSTDSGSQNSGSQPGSDQGGNSGSGSDAGGSGTGDNTGGSGDEPGGSDH